MIREFADHVAADVKQLVEDEQTGEQSYRYLRTGADHYSLAFTYARLAATTQHGGRGLLAWMRQEARAVMAD